MHNTEIADLFNQLADVLEIEDANPFRVRAYRTAARNISGMSHSLSDMVANNEDLTSLPGIGKDLAAKIETIVKTGELPALKKEMKNVPKGLTDMLMLQGIGPKKVKKLHDELDIKNFSDLEKAAKAHKIKELSGFGAKTEEHILKEIKKWQGVEKRFNLADTEDIANELIEYLKKFKGTKKAIVAGSYRRRKETVGDLDILVTNKNGKETIDYFTNFEKISDVISKGSTRSTVILNSGLQVDLRVVPEKSYGAAMHYFTGSKAHNIALRKLAVNQKLKFNEYGLFKGEKQIAGKTEEEIYKYFKMDYIEPELRENKGEIEAAINHKLPTLVKLEDIKGDLHAHTLATDGQNTIEEMIDAAKKLGYQYIAITDHTKHLTVAHGQDEKRLLQQIKKIDKINNKQKSFRILKSAEVDILEDGSLDISDDVLKELDLTVCSVHYKFNLSEKKQTERILKAMDNQYFNILAHPTGRLLGKRDAYQINLEKIIEGAKARGCFIELNAQPLRMDLSDTYCRLAKESGVKVVISTDSHSTSQLQYMKFGIGQARRAWLTKNDVLNSLPLQQLLKKFKK